MRPAKHNFPETPDQKEIRLLKKRLQNEKKSADYYREKWLQEEDAHRKTKQELYYAVKIADLSQDSIYKTVADTFMTQNKTLLSMLKHEEEATARWKEKYEDLSKKYDHGTDDIRLDIMTRIGELCKDYLEDGQGDNLGTFEDRMNLMKKLTAQSYAEIVAESNMRDGKPKKKTVHLICIKADEGGKLEELNRYTSPGLVDRKDLLYGNYYPINELGGEIFSPEHFVISKGNK